MSKDLNEFVDIKVEKIILRHLLQNKQFCQNVIMFERIVDEHFTKLFHVDAFTTIRSFYNKYGSPPPTIEKFELELEKNFTPTDTFKTSRNQLDAWGKGAKNLFLPIDASDERNLESDMDALEEFRKKRIIQSFLYYGSNKLENGGDVDAIFEKMAEDIGKVKSIQSTITEGNIVEDWSQHLELMRQIESGELRPVPCGIMGAIEYQDSNTFKKVSLDDLLDGGFFPAELTILVGENNVGKSFALMEIAYYASRVKFNVLFFTIEMNKIKQERRIYSRMTKIPYRKFKLAILSKRDKRKVEASLKYWSKNCGILHTVAFDKGATVIDIINKTKDNEQKYNCKFDLLVIDYLNDMKPIGKYQSSKSWDAQGEISWDLAQLCKYYNNHKGIPIVSANQKKTSVAGTSRTNWQDAAFSPLPIQHSTVGIGIGQSGDDEELGRIRWDLFKSRDSKKNVSFYTYPDFAISKISSTFRLNEYYSEMYDEQIDE